MVVLPKVDGSNIQLYTMKVGIFSSKQSPFQVVSRISLSSAKL